jgi:opacity protein-like surface antigen
MDYPKMQIMTKRILAGVFVFIGLPFIGMTQLTHIGLEAGFASEVKEPGFGLNAIYRVNDEIKLNPKLVYFLPHKINTSYGNPLTEGTQQFDWWMINLDGNYVLLDQGIVEGFGIMGLNFSNVNWERDERTGTQPEDEKRQVLKLGLNIGAGVRFNLGDRVSPYAELRYTLGGKADWLVTELNTSQFGIYAGVLIRINEDKERGTEEDY